MTIRAFTIGIFALLVGAASVRANAPAGIATFVENHCATCHDADTKKGNLDLSALKLDTSSQSIAAWTKVVDRVAAGEMPPKNKRQPEAAAKADFLKSLSTSLAAVDVAREKSEGRAVLRRLNRFEYENAVRDLLGADWLQIRDRLPEDGEYHGFNKSGQTLDVSHVQMASYLAAADYALREVIAQQFEKPKSSVTRYYAREQSAFVRKMFFSEFNRSAERATFALLGTEAQVDVMNKTAPMTVGAADPKKRELEAMGVVASTYEPLEIKFNNFTAPASGRYKLKLCAQTFWAGSAGGAKPWQPNREKTGPGRRPEPVTLYAERPPRLLRYLGSFDIGVEPTVGELEVTLLEGETIRPDAARLFRSRPPAWRNPLAEADGAPGVAFRWLEVEGPIIDQWPTKGHTLLFGDLPIGKPAADGDTPEIVSKNPSPDADRLLRTFLATAYRRPVVETDVKRFLAVFDKAMKSNAGFAESMIAAYTAVLCSPEFITRQEKPGALDAHALATRLSLLLWNSTPDAVLRKAADDGSLLKPDVLRAQTDRLLNDARSRRFVDALADYWLDLRKINNTSPDAGLYPDYYLDDLLTESAVEETQRFLAELIRADLPARNIIASDFAFLNERLARHYGLPPVAGVGVRRVELPKGSLRGGLLTQASVLKVTANGTTTSPVLRGVWVMDRIVGKPPPPPPPSVPAIEPDTRGAVTIREQLDKHRAIESCATCHTKIDPAGFALESFDVMGGFRDRYRAISEADALAAAAGVVPPKRADNAPVPVAGYGHNGQRFSFVAGPEVDCTGELPDGGGKFDNVAGLKALLLKDERQVARNVVEKLVLYGTGADVSFADRAKVERILDAASPKQFGVRTLIHEVVQSEIFRMK